MILFFDEKMLEGTEKVSNSIYRTFGINNFKLANLCFLIGFAMAASVVVAVNTGEPFWSIFLALFLFSVLQFLIWFFLVFGPQYIYREGYMNCAREGTLSTLFRITQMISFIVTIFQDEPFLAKDIPSEELMEWFYRLWFLFTSLAVYFSSLELPPPQDSFIKKLGKRFRSFFEAQAFPQPA